MSHSQKGKGSSEGTAGCVGLLVGLAVIVFLFLSTGTQRRLVFDSFGYPPGPVGKYSPVRVLSSNLERSSFSEDRYVVTTQRSEKPIGGDENEDDPGFLAHGVLYTAECAPHFWNLCGGLTPGRDYYARWTSSEHKQIAIGELQSDGKYIDGKNIRRFDIRGWKKAEEY